MKKIMAFCLVLSAVMLAANSCSTAPAAPATNTPAAPVSTPTPSSNPYYNPTPTPAPTPMPMPTPTPTSAPTPTPTPTPPPTTQPQISPVSIQNFSFNPSSLTVSVGTTVVWTNNDPVPHQIGSDSFNSSPLSQGGTFSHKFTTAGTYDYHCTIHPSMTGTITVQ
ncbi:MAG TPA: cupredoxin family copper-binding protein [Candidatus Methylomirabilis sp.]|nr:cupredoxin family copper-binding protein [Candidatus Methylomirabilis sp.]